MSNYLLVCQRNSIQLSILAILPAALLEKIVTIFQHSGYCAESSWRERERDWMIFNRQVLLCAVRKRAQDEYASGSNSRDLGEEDGIFNASIFMHFYSPPASFVLHTKRPPSHINPHVNFSVGFLSQGLHWDLQ